MAASTPPRDASQLTELALLSEHYWTDRRALLPVLGAYLPRFGDGSPLIAGLSATHAFPGPGTYVVTETVRDGNGCTIQVSKTVTIADVETAPLVVRGRDVGLRRRYAIADTGDQLVLETIEPGGLLRRVRALYRIPLGGGMAPSIMAVADGQCRVQVARRLVYGDGDRPEYLEQLTRSLDEVEVREPLNPPVPVATEAEEPIASPSAACYQEA